MRENDTNLTSWLASPMEPAVRRVIDRVRRAEDVVHVAVMPDVHLAADVCVGTAMATNRLLYPSAVGGDIGCGMLAIAFDAGAEIIRDAANAGAILRAIGESVPTLRRHRSRTVPLPADLQSSQLSHTSLAHALKDEGLLQLGTLGGGNHFIELQADEEDRLWLMIHSGSRAMGQTIKSHHLAHATIRSASMTALDADSDAGAAYLADQDWACRYAHANRVAMVREVVEALRRLFNAPTVDELTIACDHNHVRREAHFGRELFVHRKGAMPADENLPGVVPGSMGTMSFHVIGRGLAESLRSSAHGAGRLLSRNAARERFNRSNLRQQMQGVWFDPRLSDAMREESPKSYKDVRAVMRAQCELVKVTRTLRPLLVYKGR